MLAYQQSALCEKGLAGDSSVDFSLSVPNDFSSASRPGESDSENLLIERIDTAVGSLLTQAACLDSSNDLI